MNTRWNRCPHWLAVALVAVTSGCLGAPLENGGSALSGESDPELEEEAGPCTESPKECAERFFLHWSRNYLRHVRYGSELRVERVRVLLGDEVSYGTLSSWVALGGTFLCDEFDDAEFRVLERFDISPTGRTEFTSITGAGVVLFRGSSTTEWRQAEVPGFYEPMSHRSSTQFEVAGDNRSLARVFRAIAGSVDPALSDFVERLPPPPVKTESRTCELLTALLSAPAE